jgi:hypothetical protein
MAIPSVGDELAPVRKKVFQRALAERHFKEDSVHNDAHLKRLGYPGALVSAYVLSGYASELLVRFFGERWFTAGQYTLTFTGKGVQQGDMLTCHAKVASVEPIEGGDLRISFDLNMQKDDGSTPVFGKASGVIAAQA